MHEKMYRICGDLGMLQRSLNYNFPYQCQIWEAYPAETWKSRPNDFIAIVQLSGSLGRKLGLEAGLLQDQAILLAWLTPELPLHHAFPSKLQERPSEVESPC